MDIPNTGAIFTLGKSHLAENTQSYFYIKNDPIRKLIAGPCQSAVICESGRLFVWGENNFGQLGIGGHSPNNASTGPNNNGGIVTKPTCVKCLKTLGLKVSDIAYGNEWSVMLTYSNELFFTGRSVFSAESSVSSNFTAATVGEQSCHIIRKPFRLEEFDDCLSNSEEAENFVNVLAGNEHFVVLTSFGRIVGWGSNKSHQLGCSEESITKPHEIILNSPVEQFTCGPESTLVLTQNGGLFLTGRLHELVFPQFTELQKNLSQNEQIIFMHISHASEIFIVTNTGSIYRSLESKRNKVLIFQRFYDYDSEENGPIWKLLKGTSFYAVLTKANKFYTTFSESGHHLKTFREISKFKNLRVLDMALGDQHVLVHGIPRSSTFAATIGPSGGQRLMSQAMLSNTTGDLMNRMKPMAKQEGVLEEAQIPLYNNNLWIERIHERPKTTTPVHDSSKSESPATETLPQQTTDPNNNQNQTTTEESGESASNAEVINATEIESGTKSPTESVKSRKSINSVKTLKHVGSSEMSLRPRTPYPDSSSSSSPQTVIRKTPKRNTSYEAAIQDVYIEDTSPALIENLENIPENGLKPDVKVSLPSPPTEEDEELTLEIRETTDPLDHTVTINEIRFINNGIDVTANVKKLKSLGSDDSLDEFAANDDEADRKSAIRRQTEDFIGELEDEIEQRVNEVKETKTKVEENISAKASAAGDVVAAKLIETKESSDKAITNADKAVDSGIDKAKDSIETAASKVATEAKEVVESVSGSTKTAIKSAKDSMENIKATATKATDNALQSLEQIGSTATKVSADAKDTMGSTIRKMADDTRQAVGAVTSKISNEVQDAKNSLSTLLHGKKNKVDVEAPVKQSEASDEIHEVVIVKESTGDSRPTAQSLSVTNTPGGQQEDDERTTASVNSNHTSAGNPFESNDNTNPFDNGSTFDEELNQMIERSKKAFQEDVERASLSAEQHISETTEVVMEEKSNFSKFLDGMREKTKVLSCRNEKSVKIVEDQPPRYTEEDELALQPANGQPANGSKVCTIL